MLLIQFLACSIRLSDVNKLPIESAKYLLEVLAKLSLEFFSKPFYMMLQKERVK